MESLTDEIEAEALALITRIDEIGGAASAIEQGFQQREIEDAAYRYARAVDDGTATVVGVNRFTVEGESEPPVMVIDPEVERAQVAALESHRASTDRSAVGESLTAVTAAAEGTDNLLYPMKRALELGATVGDVTAALLPVFGRYRPAF